MHLRAEFLADEFVAEDETAEFLDAEFVVEDPQAVPNAPEVVFAGPSDAPPAFAAFPFVARAKAGAPDRWRIAYVAFAVGVSGAMAAAICARVLARDSGGEATAVVTEMPIATTAPTSTPTTTPTSTPTTEPTPSSSPAPDRDTLEATDAKRAAQHALDKGNAVVAIEQGTRSVELDSGDAEAWLILGAAYMQRGNYVKARRSFSSCVQLATRGARAECAALLR